MTERSIRSRKRNRLLASYSVSPAFLLAIAFAFTACLATACLGLSRPYDAIPDQDLLWLKEALLMHQGKNPTYPDHPGAFWQIFYTLKIKILDLFNPSFPNSEVPISPNTAKLIIRWSRLENGALTALTSILVWPVFRQLGIQRYTSAIAVSTVALSLGFLESAVQMRNEISSTFFALAFLNICLTLPIIKVSYLHTLATGAAFSCFLIAAYCKVQVLALAPFWFILVINAQYLQANISTLLPLCKTLLSRPSTMPALLTGGSLIWLISISGPVFASLNRFRHVRSEIDLPFWALISAALVISIWSRSPRERNIQEAVKIGLIGGTVSVMISRVIAHPIWTAQVFSFPSNVLGFSGRGDRLEIIMKGLHKYLSEIFYLRPSLTLPLILTLIAVIMYEIVQSNNPKSRIVHIVLSLLWSSTLAVWVFNAARPRTLYEVYLIIPTLLCLAIPTTSLYKKRASSQPVSTVVSWILIGLIAAKSASNTASITEISSMNQSRASLCQEQLFDALLSETAVGGCKNFKY